MREQVTVNRRLGLPVSLLWLIGFNLVGRVLWIIYMHPPQLADFDWYFTHAVQLAHGQGYMDQGKPTAYWPMGWPFILSLVIRIFGPHVMPGFFTNALFSTLIVCLVYALTIRIMGADNPSILNTPSSTSAESENSAQSPISLTRVQSSHCLSKEAWFAHRAALAAAFAYSLLPSQIEWNSVLGSEESFALLVLISFYIYAKLIRRPDSEPWFSRTAISGLIFGLAAIVRPIGLLFPIFLAAYEFWVNRRRIAQALLRGVTFGIAMFVGIAPVTIRNLRAMHHFVLVSTNGGVNLWQGTKINGGYFWTWNPYKNPLLKVYNDEIAKDQVGKHVAMNYIIHHPFTTLHNAMYKVFDLYKVDTNAVWYTFHVYPGWKLLLYTFDIIDTLGYWLLMTLALFALFAFVFRSRTAEPWFAYMFPTGSEATRYRMRSHIRRSIGFLMTFVVYNTLLFFFFPAWDRFRYPLMPVFATFFGLGWVVLQARRKKS